MFVDFNQIMRTVNILFPCLEKRKVSERQSGALHGVVKVQDCVQEYLWSRRVALITQTTISNTVYNTFGSPFAVATVTLDAKTEGTALFFLSGRLTAPFLVKCAD